MLDDDDDNDDYDDVDVVEYDFRHFTGEKDNDEVKKTDVEFDDVEFRNNEKITLL